jgi:hypothetical protein
VNQVIGSVKDVLIAACVTPSEKEKEALMERLKEEIVIIDLNCLGHPCDTTLRISLIRNTTVK